MNNIIINIWSLIVQVSTWLYIPKLITFIYKYIAAEFKKEKCVNLSCNCCSFKEMYGEQLKQKCVNLCVKSK